MVYIKFVLSPKMGFKNTKLIGILHISRMLLD